MSEDDDYPELRQRWNQLSNLTVGELVDWCFQQGLTPEQVNITQAGLKYKTPQTAEEEQRRAEWLATQSVRTERWERETLARLKEKYGG